MAQGAKHGTEQATAADDAVLVVGAGLAGLACAAAVEKAGGRCELIEAADDVGGRVRTDEADGFLLDRGFQVMLDSYPEARRVLDYDALDLRPFEPGALVHLRGREGLQSLRDPFRRPAAAWQTLGFSGMTLADKVTVAALRTSLVLRPASRALGGHGQTTLDFLTGDLGFSDDAVESFLRPFYGGVFLENDLSTSSRLFRWLFRMFATGSATLPARGMQAIPRQMLGRLKRTQVRLNTRVAGVRPGVVVGEDGRQFRGRAVVVATELPAARRLLEPLRRLPPDLDGRPMRSSTTLYFACSSPPTRENLLVLNGGDPAVGPVNTVAVLSNAAPSYAPPGQHLVSVSVVGDPEGDNDAVLADVRRGLRNLFGVQTDRWRHLRTYRVREALPDQSPPALQTPHKSVVLGSGLFVCGDHRDTASINGAMLAGRRAGEAAAGFVPSPVTA